MIDTTDKKVRNQEESEESTKAPESHFQRPREESDDEDDSDAGAGRGRGVLLFGFVAAAAAGTYFYAKKNNIDVEGIVRGKVQALINHFTASK